MGWNESSPGRTHAGPIKDLRVDSGCPGGAPLLYHCVSWRRGSDHAQGGTFCFPNYVHNTTSRVSMSPVSIRLSLLQGASCPVLSPLVWPGPVLLAQLSGTLRSCLVDSSVSRVSRVSRCLFHSGMLSCRNSIQVPSP